ncbi:MAG: hypothetical protein H6828_04110 [Planctomycetes bacterium]|nr:hypothetical protein [Planctomycetota bacterium]
MAFALLGLAGVLALGLAAGTRLAPADMTYNNGAEVSTLDPATVSGVPEGRVLKAIFEGLCVKDPRTLEPLPGVAEAWELSADRRTYTFHLRADARWSNGDPVTAQDFLFSWRRFLHPATAAEYAYQLWYVRGGEQYTLLDDALEYVDGEEGPLWFQELAPGRVRVGFAGPELEVLAGGRTLRVDARDGERVARGTALCRYPFGVDEQGVYLPCDATVLRVNPALSREVDEVLADPCGAQWLAELEVDPAALAELRAAGRLLPGARYRREVVEPHLLGLSAPDARTLVVALKAPTPYFLQIVAFYPLFPVNRRNLDEARERWPGDWELRWMRPENLVTNGPYRIEFRRVNDRIRLRKSETYWDAANVAFDSIDVLAVDHLGTSLNLYLTGALDWIDRPITNVIPRLMPREDFDPQPYLGSYFYRFNTTRPPFDDPRVRRALSLAVDRRAIVEKITKAGERAAWGLAPPGMGAYPTVETAHARSGDVAADLATDVAEARRLLAEAGFGPGGAEFPTFEILYNTDQTHKDIAEVVASEWKQHLGLNVKLLNQEWKVYLDSQKNKDYDVCRSAWIGDYADPNTFLDMWVTDGDNNRTGWSNARYDELIRQAAAESDEAARLAQFVEAEGLLLEELPILPLYYYSTRNLVNPRLGGFHANVLDEHFPKFWYWKSDAELARDRAALPPGTVLVDAPGPAAGKYAPAARTEDR